MWDFFSNLPVELLFILLTITVIIVTIIVLRISTKKDKNEPSITPPPTVIIQKRTCGDCILLLMGEREKVEVQINHESNKILKNQMIFVEQKLLEIQNTFMSEIADAIHKFIQKEHSPTDEVVQYKLVYGLFKDALLTIKDEMRRSFKDNGFYELDGTDFTEFIKNKISIINSILNQYIRNIFPERSNIISQDEILKIIEKKNDFLIRVFTDIYSYAKEVRFETEEKISDIKEGFKEWVDDFIKPQIKT